MKKYLLILIRVLRILFGANKKIKTNQFQVIKDENFANSHIKVIFDFENFLYVKFPKIGKKLYNGEIVLNTSKMHFPYEIKVKGLSNTQNFLIEFTPSNEFYLSQPNPMIQKANRTPVKICTEKSNSPKIGRITVENIPNIKYNRKQVYFQNQEFKKHTFL